MTAGHKIVIILLVIYLLGAVGTVAYIADVGKDRQAGGLPIFSGFTGTESPAVQLLETFLAWPYALPKSLGGAPKS